MQILVEQVLNLPGMKVLRYSEIEGLGIIVEAEKEQKHCTCPHCGTVSKSIHQNHWRTVQDLPWGERTVLLKINRRQFRCKNCQKVFSEQLDFIDKQKGHTQRLAKKIVEEVLDSNIRSTARRNDLTEEEIESMIESQIKKIEEIDLSQVTRLGLDEITLVKGQGNYLAVLVDLDTGRPIEIVKSRKKERRITKSLAITGLGVFITNKRSEY